MASLTMPSEQVVEQQIQTPAPMSADNVGIEMQQPVCIISVAIFKEGADLLATETRRSNGLRNEHAWW
ncbi:hypothetical protein CJF31_00011580 [Rutstroemia sp. NJR-2017a BVV2]|nr:hypothetical protein CJF31_00011580 [Rutstroemia sp. NJR-2017a BVV2]